MTMAPRLTDEEKATIRRLHGEGLTPLEVAKRVGRSHHTVRRLVEPGTRERYLAAGRRSWAKHVERNRKIREETARDQGHPERS